MIAASINNHVHDHVTLKQSTFTRFVSFCRSAIPIGQILPFLRDCLKKPSAAAADGGRVAVSSLGGRGSIGGGDSGGSSNRRRVSGEGVKDAGDAPQMASLCLERMVVAFSQPTSLESDLKALFLGGATRCVPATAGFSCKQMNWDPK